MPERMKEEARRKNTRRFIIATRVLIEEVGLENLSIRKIADRAGFHNSTIYLYFNDVDYLIKLASMDFFEEYTHALSKLSKKNLEPVDGFLEIWETFCHTAFHQPEIFYPFFFGKYSDNLTEIMTEYYRLFPEKAKEYSKEIEAIFFGKNIYERCLRSLKPLSGLTGLRVNGENLHLINTIIVSYVKEILHQKCLHPEAPVEDFTEETLSALKYIIGY